MNSRIKVTRLMAIILSLALFGLSAFHTPIQAQDSQTNQRRSQSRQMRHRTLMNVDFKGGTIQQYLDHLSSVVVDDPTTNLNVIVDELAKDLMLPSISFKRVELSAAVEIIEQLEPDNHRVVVQNNNSIYIIRAYGSTANGSTIPGSSGGGGGSAVARSSINRSRSRSDQTVVMSVRQILLTRSKEDLLSAIEIGLDLVGDDESRPVMKLHSETGLLFAKGNKAQLSIISDTVAQLSVSQQNTQSRARASSGQGRSNGASQSPPKSSKRDR